MEIEVEAKLPPQCFRISFEVASSGRQPKVPISYNNYKPEILHRS